MNKSKQHLWRIDSRITHPIANLESGNH